jgi:hypothetical protein
MCGQEPGWERKGELGFRPDLGRIPALATALAKNPTFDGHATYSPPSSSVSSAGVSSACSASSSVRSKAAIHEVPTHESAVAAREHLPTHESAVAARESESDFTHEQVLFLYTPSRATHTHMVEVEGS